MLLGGTHESGLPLKEMEQTRDWKKEAEKQFHEFVRLEDGEKNIPYANFLRIWRKRHEFQNHLREDIYKKSGIYIAVNTT